MVTLKVSESQLIEWVQQLRPAVKRAILRALITTLDDYDSLVTYGNERIRTIAARRGLNWETLNDRQREQLVDDILHSQSSD